MVQLRQGMKMVIIFMGASIYTFSVFAQATVKKKMASQTMGESTTSIIKPISVGDPAPHIVFQNVLNYKSKKVNLSDFRGKLVILDMWSTNCSSCIAAFPKMEKLQKIFGDKIQILLVNPYNSKYNSEERIKSVLDGIKRRTGFYPTLPIPISDTVLNDYFPHKSVPHQVWINDQGIVLAITGSIEVTESNIQSLLEGRSDINLPIKNDWAFDPLKPLLANNNGGNSGDFAFRSIFVPYLGGIGFSSGVRTNNKQEVIGVYILNYSLRQYVYEAYPEIFDELDDVRVILEVKNSEMLKREENKTNFYSYDLTIPPTPYEKLNFKEYLKEDLKRFFGIVVNRERRKMGCLIIGNSSLQPSRLTKHTLPDLDLDETSIRKYIHNYSVDQILRFLSTRFSMPLINESGITEYIDIDFPKNFDITNSDELLQFLKSLGFNIYQEQREIEVAVIRNKYDD